MLQTLRKNLNQNIDGSTSKPAIYGGYLYIYFDDQLITIVSIPSPNLSNDNNQSVVANYDEFTDTEGNKYSISIYSSIDSISWSLDDYPDELTVKRLRFEVRYNEY